MRRVINHRIYANRYLMQRGKEIVMDISQNISEQKSNNNNYVNQPTPQVMRQNTPDGQSKPPEWYAWCT